MFLREGGLLFHREESGEWVLEEKLEGHGDWVRDVAWCPGIGLPISRIASCSQVSYNMLQLCSYDSERHPCVRPVLQAVCHSIACKLNSLCFTRKREGKDCIVHTSTRLCFLNHKEHVI